MEEDHDLPLEDRRGRGDILQLVATGDLIHARNSSNASLICLVTAVDNDFIHCRRITTQQIYIFDRTAGLAVASDTHNGGEIDSVEPLPISMHNTLLGLERRIRLGKRTPENIRLTAAEKKALVFVHDHYESAQI